MCVGRWVGVAVGGGEPTRGPAGRGVRAIIPVFSQVSASFEPVLSHCVDIQDPKSTWPGNSEHPGIGISGIIVTLSLVRGVRGKVGHGGKERRAHLNTILQY